ncbi:MAG: hypothetical protein LKF10_06710 [Eubacterium sp.]|nr:hypothetical protein [Eubacterium sp.]
MDLRDEVIYMRSEMVLMSEKMKLAENGHPQGRMDIKRKESSTYYCSRVMTGDKWKVRVINHNPRLIRAYLKKKYYRHLKPVVRQNIAAADRFLARYRPVNEVYRRIRDSYPELPDEYFNFTWSAEKWAAGYRQPENYYADGLIHRSADGGSCRSKNEVIIRDHLYQHHIHYKYEAELVLEGITFHPDFTIMRNSDGRLIYWEHCGMVTDQKKIEGHKRKLAVYERNGIVPWKNLIVTYDQEDGGINARLIDAYIDAVLLQ